MTISNQLTEMCTLKKFEKFYRFTWLVKERTILKFQTRYLDKLESGMCWTHLWLS